MLNVVNWDVIMTGLVVVIIVIYISHQVVRIIRMEVLHMENLRIVQNLRIQKAIIPKVIQEVQVTVIVVTHIRIIIHHIAIQKKNNTTKENTQYPYDEGYNDAYNDYHYDYDRYDRDISYARGVEDAMDDLEYEYRYYKNK